MLTETWLHSSILDGELFLPEYQLHRSERLAKLNVSKHGGVLIAVRTEFDSKRIELDNEILGATVACSINYHNSNILLVCFYNPPETDGKPNPHHISTNKVICIIKEVIEISKSYRSIILYGDFNLQKVDWNVYSTDNPEEQMLLDVITQNNFQQIVEFPTSTASGILDLVFINSETETITCKPTSSKLNALSNHTGIDLKFRVTTLQEDYLRRETQPSRILSYCNANFDLIQQKMVDFPFSGICWSNINVLLNQWYEWLNTIISECVPYRTRHRSRLAPWIKPKTSNWLKKLQTARKNYPDKISKLLKLESTCSAMIEADRADYESNLGSSRSTTSLFRYFRSFKSTSIPLTVNYSDETANDPKSQCTLFSEYFSKIFKQSSVPTFDELSETVLEPLRDFDISISKIENVCNSLVISKAAGPDGIPPILFKKCAKSLSKSLFQIFTKIKQTGVYPMVWKQAVVVPTFKKGSKSDVENYRQVSLLCIVSKIFERILFDVLYNYLKQIFSPSQFGFRKGRSCVIQMVIYLETLYDAYESGKDINVIYTDYEKAFDKVDHGLLLQKLHKIGIRGRLLKLLQSYLTGRSQRIRIRGCFSDERPISSGVPQGSILSSLLFIIYINDLPDLCKSVLPLLCADDAKFIAINKPKLPVQIDLSRVKRWSDYHGLPLNTGKCNDLALSNSNTQYYFAASPILKTDCQKDLGILVSKDLKWDLHIKTACSKALGVFFMLKRSSPTLSLITKLNLYKSMVVPTLIYGSVCWFNNVTNTKCLEKVQKRCTRWISSDWKSNYKQLLLKCNLLPLSLYLQLQDILFLMKCMGGRFDYNFDRYLCVRDHPRPVRSDNYLTFAHRNPRSTICQQSFFTRTMALINRLPNSLNFQEPEGLKARILKHLWSHFEKNYNELVSDTWKL